MSYSAFLHLSKVNLIVFNVIYFQKNECRIAILGCNTKCLSKNKVKVKVSPPPQSYIASHDQL